MARDSRPLDSRPPESTVPDVIVTANVILVAFMIVIVTMIVIVIIFTIKSLYLVLFNWLQARFIFNVQISLSNKLFSGYILQPYLFHLNKNSSSLIRNIITEVNTFASCTTSIIILFTEILVFFGISVLLIIYEPMHQRK